MGSLRRGLPVAVVVGLALSLLATSAAHHASEVARIDHTGGPLSAFAVDAVPAVVLLFAGYWLHNTAFDAHHRWVVAAWSTVGGVVFAGVTTATIAIRELEGRDVPEPVFPLLVDTGVGAVAGFAASVFYVRAQRDAERARRARHAFSFVNDVLRHDVRNSLGVVRGHTEMVAESTDDAGVEARANTIREQTDDALDRIESAGTIARTISDDDALEPVDLAAVAETVAARVENAYPVTVATDLPENAHVRANDAVRSVVDNLVENAAEHNDADDPRVMVVVEPREDAVRLEVQDNGPGVSDDVLADADGGLDLVQALVDHYGGDLRVAETEPRGTVFVVDLPRANAD